MSGPQHWMSFFQSGSTKISAATVYFHLRSHARDSAMKLMSTPETAECWCELQVCERQGRGQAGPGHGGFPLRATVELSLTQVVVGFICCVLFCGVPRQCAVKMEFSQIDNVDVDVNIDLKSHPVGSTTPQKKKVQSSKYLFFSLPDMFADKILSWYFPLKFIISADYSLKQETNHSI